MTEPQEAQSVLAATEAKHHLSVRIWTEMKKKKKNELREKESAKREEQSAPWLLSLWEFPSFIRFVYFSPESIISAASCWRDGRARRDSQVGFSSVDLTSLCSVCLINNLSCYLRDESILHIKVCLQVVGGTTEHVKKKVAWSLFWLQREIYQVWQIASSEVAWGHVLVEVDTFF